MARPTVLVATTNPAMAYALQASLKDKCISLGLKLDICPDGDESNLGGETVRTYDSAEALFDALEKRDPMELADTLVVLDVGAVLDNAFAPQAGLDSGWHVTANRAGVAVELLLRFPQVFPVFLSPAVPITGSDNPTISSCFNDKLQAGKEVDTCETGCWKGFCSLQEKHAVKHKWIYGNDVNDSKAEAKSEPLDIQHLFALAVPLHFVSPLDGGNGLKATLTRFANGMHCWFDPTGLRTLVKNRFLGTVFGNDTDWGNTWPSEKNQSKLREALLERLKKMAVAVDEEREFALLSAYTSWKFGRRAWLVTTNGEFDKGLWSKQQPVRQHQQLEDVIVLRDVDLRFPDVNTGANGMREKLKNICSAEWSNKLDDEWYVRVISGDEDVNEHLVKDNQFGQETVSQVGEKKKLKYFGLRKPIGSLYELKKVLGAKAQPARASVQSTIGVAGDCEDQGGHGAPYSNLAMAEALLRHSSACNGSPSSHLIGALLAMEAYELLLGMSKTTALEALLAMHRHEVIAEVSFLGVSDSVDVEERRKDIEATLDSLYTNRRDDVNWIKSIFRKDGVNKIKSIFLSQFWSELKVVYRNGEQFSAAESANARSLVHSEWTSRWLSRWVESDKWTDKFFRFLKSWVVNTATSLGWWFFTSILLIVIAWIVYLHVSCDCYFVELQLEINKSPNVNVDHLFFDAVLSSITLQPMGLVEIIRGCGLVGTLVVIAHLGLAYILFGLLISMLYRKITRS